MDNQSGKVKEISLVDIIALCVRKIVFLFICAILGGALFTVFHVVSVNRRYNPVAVERALAEKKEQLEKEKAAKNLEYKLVVGSNFGSVTSADYDRAIELFTSLDKSVSSLEADVSILERVKSTGIMPYSIPKYAAIGFLVGGFIGLFVIVLGFIVSEPLTRSDDFIFFIGIPLLGAVFSENGCFVKLSRKIYGEVDWVNKETALKWFEENLNSTVLPDGAKVAVLYSGNDFKALETAKEVLAVLNKKGYETTFTENAYLNPETNSRVQSSDVVLLYEKQWISKWKNVNADVEIAKRFEKKVAGFILC